MNTEKIEGKIKYLQRMMNNGTAIKEKVEKKIADLKDILNKAKK